ncbi:hypothetical protein F7725_025383 [Dissostichus mawsoni]|uniref:Uncharacterized protein n=1 Tax=Dissostichus mawsoni TaxID=36200 RepID=A0A7J5XBW7_DISMA|nr:hypothetical protein F7725_025383 [Dissostichus mawsoni]
MRDGKLVGVPLSKDTRKKLMLLRKKRGRLQEALKKKKVLAQLRVKGCVVKAKAWSGGAVTVTGLSSMEIPIKRFPCPICPSATYALQGCSAGPPRRQASAEDLRPQRPPALPGLWQAQQLTTQSLETPGQASEAGRVPMLQMSTPLLELAAPGPPRLLLPGAAHQQGLGTDEDEVPAARKRPIAGPASAAGSGPAREINSTD